MTLRLGVVGAGDVALRDYLPELPRLGNRIELTAVAARTEERARAAAERFGARRWTTGYRELVAADDVDAILNLTPFTLHVEVTLAALEAGKHVYSEKPLAPTVAEADRIFAAADERGLTVVAAPSVLLFPQVQRALELVRSGALGAIHSARGRGLGGIPPWEGYISDPSPYFAEPGGPLADMAVYPLHALTGLLGPVRRVAALSARTRSSFTVAEGRFQGLHVPVEVDDQWQLLVELEGGCLVSVEASNAADHALAPELELLGEAGALGLSLLDVAQPLRIAAADGVREEHVPHERESGPDHLLGVEHLVDCVERGTPPLVGIEHARHVIEVLEAARRSARSGTTQSMTSSFPRATAAEPEVTARGG
jgi:predicted dehydrogenase